jgi:hypothetical protein
MEKTISESDGKSPESGHTQKRSRISVRVISNPAPCSAVVEYTKAGKLARVVVPAEFVIGGAVDADLIEAGVPYGLPIASLVTMKSTPEALENHLHNLGIWTAEDILTHPAEVQGALQATYAVDASTIFMIASKATKE